MDLQDKIELYRKNFLEEEEKCLNLIEDPWFHFNIDGEIETSPDIIIIEFADESSDIYRGLSFLPDKYVLFFNSGEINKSYDISKEKAIEYMILCDKDLIIELNLDAEAFNLLHSNEVLNAIYNGEFKII